jgi:competence protein ComEC
VREPLIAPAAAVAAGILLSRLVPFQDRELIAAILALACLSIFALWRVTRRASALACLCALVFGGALLERTRRLTSPPQLDAAENETVILAGCVVEPPVMSADRQRFVLELEPGARVRVSISSRPGESAPTLEYGRPVEMEARVRRPHNFRNPGNFDYVHYLARRDIHWTATARAPEIRVAPGQCGSFWARPIMRLRASALDRIEKLYGNRPYETGMMQAVLFGETSRLESVWTEQFRATGTFHALVISGAHLAALAGMVLLILRCLPAPVWAQFAVTTAVAWTYTLVAGGQAPVVRSAIGFTLYAVARCFFRRAHLMNLLSAVALVFLIADPQQLFEASFQLSFLAVAFIAALAVPLLDSTSRPVSSALAGLADRGRDLHLAPRVAQIRVELRLLAETIALWTRAPERVCIALVQWPLRAAVLVYDAAVLSAIVQLGLALPMAVYFHRVSFSGVSANVLIGFPMTWVVALGLAAVLTGLWPLAIAAAWLLQVSQRIVEWHARLEPAWRVPTPPLWLGVAIAAALLAAALAERAPRVWRHSSYAALALLAALMIWHPFAPSGARGEMSLTAFDVGQGDGLLLDLPDGARMLIDGGGIPSYGRKAKPQLDIGEDVVSPALWNRSIKQVDIAVLSHGHEDHLGGLRALIENFHPRELWAGVAVRDPGILRTGIRVRTFRRGDTFRYGGAEFTVIAPARDYEPAASARNNDSLVLRVRHGKQTFLLSGDIERAVEDDIVSAGLAANAGVLKVAHHGSKTSTGDELLEQARPAFAIISAGAGNTYGHPNPDVLERLARRRIGILRTDELGEITIRTDGRRLFVDAAVWQPPAMALDSAF